MEGSKSSIVKLQKCTAGNQKQIWKYDTDVNCIDFKKYPIKESSSFRQNK
jgi:hypothetical protein